MTFQEEWSPCIRALPKRYSMKTTETETFAELLTYVILHLTHRNQNTRKLSLIEDRGPTNRVLD